MSGNPYESPETHSIDPTELTSDVRNWAMLCHLSSLSFLVTGFGHILGPLIIWMLKRTEHPFIDDQGKESLNFQISMTLYTILAALTICIAIGFVLVPVLLVVNIVYVVMASIKASNGEAFRYPLTIRLVK